MASAAVLRAIDKYAALYQGFVKTTIEWDTNKQKFICPCGKKQLVIWHCSSAILFINVLVFFTCCARQLFIIETHIPLWIVLCQSYFFLFGLLVCLYTVGILRNAKDIVFAWNELVSLNHQFLQGKIKLLLLHMS